VIVLPRHLCGAFLSSILHDECEPAYRAILFSHSNKISSRGCFKKDVNDHMQVKDQMSGNECCNGDMFIVSRLMFDQRVVSPASRIFMHTHAATREAMRGRKLAVPFAMTFSLIVQDPSCARNRFITVKSLSLMFERVN
jgi:hypothetical protein